MKVAIIGSRNLYVDDFKKYLPPDTTEIVSGGAKGIDTCAERYAKNHNIPIKIFLPKYEKYGRSATLKRNIEIIDYADTVLAFWDGKSKGTKFVINKCREKNKSIRIFINIIHK